MFQLLVPNSAQASFLFQDISPTPSAIPTDTVTPTVILTSTPDANLQNLTWLSTPEDARYLASDRSLALLAGQLIFHGLIDASSCADGGLLETGAANPCGETVAHDAVIVWQNQFDAEILDAAAEYNIPPFILKQVFVKESQFWPETYQNPVYGGEYGLGHITLMGVDTLLSWNRAYYKKLCNQNFNKETCEKEYVFQDSSIQAGLKGVVISFIDADCSTCLGGVDLEKARKSVFVTAAMLAANRNHVEWLVNGFSSTNKLSLENKWRFTLSSYNVGPGCFTNAFYSTRGNGNPLSWKDVSKRFGGACKLAGQYVDFIEQIDIADPAAVISASLDPSVASRMVLGPLQTATPVPTITISSTSTEAVAGTGSEAPTVTLTTGEAITPASNPTEALMTGSETPTPAAAGSETPAEPSATATLTSTETPTPTSTATPIAQPTEFVPESNTATGEIIVKFGGLVPEFIAESAVGLAGGEIQTQVDALGLTIVSAPVDQIPQVLDSLQNNIFVEYVEPSYAVQAFYTPNDTEYINQTYLADMQIPKAWDVARGDGVIVAVIDTGVDVLHLDLASSIWVTPGEDGLDTNGKDKRTNLIDDDNDGYVDNWMGWNFVNNNNDARDGNGHGTHAAGIIAAQMDNSQGIAGIAPNARIMAIKALDDTGFGTYAQVAQAIVYAVDHGAKIINLGFGGTANSELLLAATDYAYTHGVTVVAAGGNTGAQTLIYPAANPNVIGVSAVDENLNAAAFSSYTNAVQISAPGVEIYSTTPGGNYASMSGTSMSTAQISGVAALLASQPKFSMPDQIRIALFNTALDLGDPGMDMYYGYGLAQAFNALGYGTTIPMATAPAQPTPTNVPATPDPNAGGGVNIMAQEIFWAQAQTCATLTNGANSLIAPYGFDSNVARCVNAFAPNGGWLISDLWRPTNITTTSYTSIYSATMDIRFYMAGLSNDTYEIQYSPNNGTNWYPLETFDATSLPPAVLTQRTYNVSAIVDTPAEVNNFQVRIWGTIRSGGADSVSIYLDQVSLTIVQNTAPTISITAPGNGTSHIQDRLVTFSGTSTDAEEGALTGLIAWKEGATTLGSGGSFNTTSLSLGSHTITASVTDNRGLTTSTSVTITIIANTAPTVAITSPGNGSSFAKGVSITFTGTATDAQDGNIAPNLSWVTDIDGPIGTGPSFSVDHLTPGTHTITAWVTDLDGATGSANITLTVTRNQGPHGNFSSTTDGCALCHLTHTAQSSSLLTYSSSAYASNDFCLSCHSSGVSMVSTHSNKDALGKRESIFELLCIQCHDPHGSSNLFAVRGNVRMGVMPTDFKSMIVLPVPVVFTALKNANSFDEVDVPEDAANNADDICVTCHINAGNPGAPMVNHAGGPNHLGANNYVGQSCIYCHPHNADNNASTKDGFMPVRGSCVGCHSSVQGTRRAIVSTSGDFVRSSHHANAAVTDADCQLCHDQSQHMAGKVRLLNVDISSTVYALDGINDPADYENFCLSCHDSNGAKGDTSPFSDNVNMAGTSLQINLTSWNAASHNLAPSVGSCINCHDNGHGSNKANMLAPWNYTSAGTPTADLMKQEEYFCYECHKSGGVASTNIMTNYTLTTRWVQLAAGENNLTTLNDRHDISTPDQTISGAKMECITCHNPHTDNPSIKVIVDPDPTDGRVPGTGFFAQGNSTDFFSDWCLDCHDGSYPSTLTPPTNALVNIYGSMSVNTHGAAVGNVGTLEGGFGYTTNSIVQCRQCHGIHVQAPTPVNSVSNFFSLLLRVRNASNTADIPTDPTASNSFLYELTNNSVTTPTASGYNWCQTCHTSSMGSNKTNCFSCHYHGASGKW